MAEHSDPSQSNWRLRPIQRDARKSRARARMQMAGLAAVLLAALGALVGMIFFLSPHNTSRFLPIVLHEYRADFPQRAWARQDGEALRDLNWAVKPPDTLNSQERKLLRNLLKDQFEGRSGPVDSLVVYLSAYIVTKPSKNNEPCLLAIDDRLDDPDNGIPLAEVFDLVGKSQARHKLLLLDVMQPLVLPCLGLLRSDAADPAFEAVEKAVKEHPTLQVLCACSPGQVSHTSDELGQSVFAYFVARGLAGQAAVKRDGTRGKRVTAKALVEYVKRHVDGWAERNLGERQTPLALNVTADFDMLVAQKEAPEYQPALPDAYPDWLKAGWQRHDRWWAEGAHRRSPRLVADLGAEVLQAELRWRSGRNEADVKEALSSSLETLERKRGRLTPPVHAPGVTLAQALERDPEQAKLADRDSADMLRLLAARRDGLARDRGDKGDKDKPDKDKTGEAKASNLNADIAEFTKKFKGKPLALASLACGVACDNPVGPEGFRLFGELLEPIELPAHEEVAFLKRMAARAGLRPGDWSAEVAQLAMQTSRESARAGTASEEALRWIDHSLERARQARRRAEPLLFDTDGKWKDASRVVEAALGLYKGVNSDRVTVEKAAQARDEGLAWLPGFVGAVELDAGNARVWLDAAESTRKLRKLLEAPHRLPGHARQAAFEQMDRATEELQKAPQSLYSLRRLVEPSALRALIKQSSKYELADGRKYQALLATTWLSGAQRQQTWAEYRACCRDRHEATLADFEAPRPKLSDPTEWGEADQAAGRAKLLQADLTRARRSLSRLKLVSDDDTEAITELLARAEADRKSAVRWSALAEGLKKAWAKARAKEAP